MSRPSSGLSSDCARVRGSCHADGDAHDGGVSCYGVPEAATAPLLPFRCPKVRKCGLVAVWLCGRVAVWLNGCMAIWLYGCKAVCMTVCLPGCLSGWLCDCLAMCSRSPAHAAPVIPVLCKVLSAYVVEQVRPVQGMWLLIRNAAVGAEIGRHLVLSAASTVNAVPTTLFDVAARLR